MLTLVLAVAFIFKSYRLSAETVALIAAVHDAMRRQGILTYDELLLELAVRYIRKRPWLEDAVRRAYRERGMELPEGLRASDGGLVDKSEGGSAHTDSSPPK